MTSPTIKKIKSIRSGGQTGVDRAAMDVTKEYGILLCGWCPKDGWAEDYPEPPGLLRDYPELAETPLRDTSQRTLWNMRDAEAILTIIPEHSKPSEGTNLGLKEGHYLCKPMFTAMGLDDIPTIVEWVNGLQDGVELCIGGPRASECGDAYDVARAILINIIDIFINKEV